VPEVIADTSPLQYLHQTRHLLLLPALYGRVIVPEAVANEIAAGRSRGVDLPDPRQLAWIEVRSVERRLLLPTQADLGLGEREVLALATGEPGALALLDDAQARRHARAAGVSFTGTLGVLLRAKQEGRLASLAPVLARLEVLGFYLDASTREAALELAGEG
jgi:predicted nucleic acid-binding protein